VGALITPIGGTEPTLPVDRVPGRTSPLAADAETQAERSLGIWLAPAGSRFLVLWSAQIQIAGVGTVVVATVALRTPDGGGPYATTYFNTDGVVVTQPAGTGVIGDPQKSLIAMRLADATAGGPTDTLQIIAPPGAVRVEVLRDGQLVAAGALQLGVGAVQLAPTGTGSVTVRAYSATDSLLADHSFTDDAPSQAYPYEKDIVGW
jgi:hypothetical protein